MRKQELHPHTAVINRKQKNQSKKARLDALNWLASKFPPAFDNTTMIQPLKLGIMTDILTHADEAFEAGVSKSKLREALVIYTRRIDYLTCLKAREMRVDLLGNPVSFVTEEEAERAAVKIKKRIEKSSKNAKKAALVKTVNEPREISKRTNKSQTEPSSFPSYPERAPAFSAHYANNASPVARPAVNVVIKPKLAARQFDPEAVARLKEKLGLSGKEK